jgi:hypothetical protein
VLSESKNVAATPVPLSGIASGEPGALLVSEIDPLTVPAALGVKTALNVKFFPELMVNGVVRPLRLNPAPEIWACEMVTAAVPEFAKLIGCELLLPTVTLPNAALVGLAPSCD